MTNTASQKLALAGFLAAVLAPATSISSPVAAGQAQEYPQGEASRAYSIELWGDLPYSDE